MDLHVISLPCSERRLLAIERASQFNYSVIFHDALDLRGAATSELTQIFNVDKYKAEFGSDITGGEIGCVKSHFDLYKKLSKLSSDYYLIAEDDFIPQFNADVTKSVIEDSINIGADIILMGYSKMNPYMLNIYNLVNPLLELVYNHDLGYSIGPRYKNTSSGAVGYAVSKRFVEKMALLNDLPWFVADEWSIYSSFGFNIVHVSPTFFLEDYVDMNSTLESERLPQHRLKMYTPTMVLKDILKLPFRMLKGFCYLFLMRTTPYWRSQFKERSLL